MAKMYIGNQVPTLNACDLAIKRLSNTQIAVYRKIVDEAFRRILAQTPQNTGNAVAHWTIGINAPAPAPTENVPNEDSVGYLKGRKQEDRQYHKGDRRWIRQAIEREIPKLKNLRRDDKVYITNLALGKGGGVYMMYYQDKDYWVKHLRDVNKPYETVVDSKEYVKAKYKNGRVYPFKAYVPGDGGDPF